MLLPMGNGRIGVGQNCCKYVKKGSKSGAGREVSGGSTVVKIS
jgi:hypothetical protein